MKRVFAVMLCLLLAFPTCGLAAPAPSGELASPGMTSLDSQLLELRYPSGRTSITVELDSQLEQLGYPMEYIQRLDTDLKESLIAEQATYVDHVHNTQYLGDAEGIRPMGTVDNLAEDFALSLVSSGTGMRVYRLTYSWQWLFAPFVTLTDKAAIAWESGWDFNDQEDVIWSYTAHSDIGGTFSKTQSGKDFTSPGLNSVTYAFDILNKFPSGGIDRTSTWHSGWISVYIMCGEAGHSGADSIACYAQYFHQDLPIPGTISYDGSFSFTISPSAAWSESSGHLESPIFYW